MMITLRDMYHFFTTYEGYLLFEKQAKTFLSRSMLSSHLHLPVSRQN